jgi:hypothetical protein
MIAGASCCSPPAARLLQLASSKLRKAAPIAHSTSSPALTRRCRPIKTSAEGSTASHLLTGRSVWSELAYDVSHPILFSRKDSETKKSMEVVVKKPSFCTSLLGLLDLEAPGGGRVGGLWRLDDHLLRSLQIAGGKTGRWWASLARKRCLPGCPFDGVCNTDFPKRVSAVL